MLSYVLNLTIGVRQALVGLKFKDMPLGEAEGMQLPSIIPF